MTMQSKWRHHIQEHKSLFIILAIGLFLVELEIFALATMHSGRRNLLQVVDARGNLVYETRSAKLDANEKDGFEATYGPLSDYEVKLVTLQRPFPFRAWLAAAAGLPIGAVLLFGFIIKAYEALFFRSERRLHATEDPGEAPSDKWERLFMRVARLNIFVIGGFVLLIVLGLFAIPHLVTEFGRYGAAVISKYRWVMLAAVTVSIGLLIWMIYLRYLLAGKAIETRAEIEKYRLELEWMGRQGVPGRVLGTGRTLELPHLDLPDLPDMDGHDRSSLDS